jgi:hypothetical protein
METMKQPTQLWQLVISIIVMVAGFMTGIINQSNQIAKLTADLENVKIEQYSAQIASDKKFDKMELKIDAIQADTRQILINLEKKADRQ